MGSELQKEGNLQSSEKDGESASITGEWWFVDKGVPQGKTGDRPGMGDMRTVAKQQHWLCACRSALHAFAQCSCLHVQIHSQLLIIAVITSTCCTCTSSTWALSADLAMPHPMFLAG